MNSDEKMRLTRRDFLKLASTSVIGLGVSFGFAEVLISGEVAVVPASEGYLLVDVKKCAGCMSCMLASHWCTKERRIFPWPEYKSYSTHSIHSLATSRWFSAGSA